MRSLTVLVVIVLALSVVFSGCYTMNHVVGDGSKSGTKETARQWFVLWGLVPLGKVDSKAMSGGAKDYTVKTEMSVIDVVIGIFTSIVTVVPMTVEVSR